MCMGQWGRPIWISKKLQITTFNLTPELDNRFSASSGVHCDPATDCKYYNNKLLILTRGTICSAWVCGHPKGGGEYCTV